MKKYYLEGITEENQRKLFENALNIIGPCKLYTSYGATSKSKLKPTGLLSFIRERAIKAADFDKLKAALEDIGVKIFEYVHEKGMKVSLNLINFIGDEYENEDDVKLHEIAETKAREII